MNKKIGVIGAGRMGEALIRGLLEAKVVSPGNLYASDVDAKKIKKLRSQLGISTSNNNGVAQKSDIIVFAVKPNIIKKVIREVKKHVHGRHLLISIAAGVPLEKLEDELPRARWIRVMPNIAATVGEGASAFCLGGNARKADGEIARRIFGAVGRVVEVSENLMDAVTGLSGSGPAFIFIVIEALADAGVREGLDRKTALELAAQTVLGAAKMTLETGKHPAELKDMVTSPGGTTIRGVEALEQRRMRGAIISAVKEATRRSKEISRNSKK